MIKKLSILLIPLLLYSCKNEPSKSFNKQEVIDSTTIAIKKKFYAQQIDSVFSKYKFNGNVGVFVDSIEVFRKNQGYENFQSKELNSSNTVFPIGSVSKQFTAVLLLKQVELGTIKLSDPFSKYLDSYQNTEFKSSTIEQLLNHTSGVSDSGNSLQSKPGKEFNYSNKGYYLLGQVLEKITGKSYTENAQELFNSIQLKNTFTALNFKGDHFGSAYLGNATNQEKIAGMPERLAEKSISIAAGGILSTVDDLHRWNQALYSGKIVKSELVDQFIAPNSSRAHPIFGKMDYGYGIMIHPNEPKSYFHSGYIKGAPALNVYFPHNKTSVIILSNIADESKGKNAIFQPHKDIYKIANSIELATK